MTSSKDFSKSYWWSGDSYCASASCSDKENCQQVTNLRLSNFSMLSQTSAITQTCSYTTYTCTYSTWIMYMSKINLKKKRPYKMCNQVNTASVYSHPLCILQWIFSQATIAREGWSIASWLSEGRQTSSLALNTFEHFFLCTAGSCPVLQPDHPLLLVDQTHSAWSPHRHNQDKIPFNDTALRISIYPGKKLGEQRNYCKINLLSRWITAFYSFFFSTFCFLTLHFIVIKKKMDCFSREEMSIED